MVAGVGTLEPKPGYKTTEFWMSLSVTILGALMASGVFADDSPVLKLVGAALAALTQLNYTVSRFKVKNETNKVITNTVSDDVINRLTAKLSEYKQSQVVDENRADPGWEPNAID